MLSDGGSVLARDVGFDRPPMRSTVTGSVVVQESKRRGCVVCSGSHRISVVSDTMLI
jgi:hypothetical protein